MGHISYRTMRICRNLLLSGLLLLLLSSCTKELEIPVELLNTDRTVEITIHRFPSYYSDMEISVFHSYPSFIARSNPIYRDFTNGVSDDQIVTLHDVDEGVLYLTVTTLNSSYQETGTYYFTDSIPVPEYSCDVRAYISRKKWIRD